MTISVLVTGGAGYIGAHTCKALSTAGYRPITLDNFSSGHRRFVRWGPIIEADIADIDAVVAACRSYGVVAAMHFAARALVGESMIDPAKYYRNNVAGTLSLLDGLRQAGIETIVFSSSCAIYGAPEIQPISENTYAKPINPYGASKLMAERIIADYARSFGLRWCALRYFNACGADPRAEIGELRAQETHLIPRAMMWLQGYLEEFRVFGADFPTPDGTAVRDYIHVCDLADAHILALKRLLDGQPSDIFNLGTGVGYSVRQILGAIEKVAGLRLPAAVGERRAGDPPVLVADPAYARRVLGFDPSHSDLETIMKTAWTWHQMAHPRRAPAPARKMDVLGGNGH